MKGKLATSDPYHHGSAADTNDRMTALCVCTLQYSEIAIVLLLCRQGEVLRGVASAVGRTRSLVNTTLTEVRDTSDIPDLSATF